MSFAALGQSIAREVYGGGASAGVTSTPASAIASAGFGSLPATNERSLEAFMAQRQQVQPFTNTGRTVTSTIGPAAIPASFPFKHVAEVFTSGFLSAFKSRDMVLQVNDPVWSVQTAEYQKSHNEKTRDHKTGEIGTLITLGELNRVLNSPEASKHSASDIKRFFTPLGFIGPSNLNWRGPGQSTSLATRGKYMQCVATDPIQVTILTKGPPGHRPDFWMQHETHSGCGLGFGLVKHNSRWMVVPVVTPNDTDVVPSSFIEPVTQSKVEWYDAFGTCHIGKPNKTGCGNGNPIISRTSLREDDTIEMMVHRV